MVSVSRGITWASALAVAVLTVLLAVTDAGVAGPLAPMVALAASFLPVGLFLVRRLGPTPVAWSVWATGFAALGWLIARAASEWTVGAWATQWLFLPAWGLLVVVLLRFPDAPRRGWRHRLVAMTYAVLALACLALALGALAAPRTLVTDPEAAVPRAAALAARVGALAAFALVPLAVAAVTLLARAARRAPVEQRWNYAALIPAAILFPTGVALDVAGLADATVAGIAAVPLGIGVAVLESAWQDLDVVIDRRLVAAGVWIVVFCLLALLLLVAEPVGGALGRPGAAVALAAVVVALSLVHRRLLHAAHRWLFGGTDDPYDVVRHVGERMDAALDPAETLRRSPAALARALRLPYAALVLTVDGTDDVAGEFGRRLVEPVGVPLVAGGATLGRIEVSPRGHGQRLTTVETELVATVARHAARVAEAHLLARAVNGAREQLVVAREEERLRLRNDLHDGLGPLLAGARMQLAAAGRSADDGRRSALVEGAAADLGTATRSVRELVEGLRPAALDDGLVAALGATVTGLLPDCATTVEVRGDLPALPAAVEIAAYRIATEAVTNVARHARGATRCVVLLTAGADLLLTVTDDGEAAGDSAPGVGQGSMRARAEELGGRVDFTSGAGGTTVRALLPLAARAASRDVVPGVPAENR